MLAFAGSLLAAIFGVLLAVLGWMGNKLYLKVDEISQTMHKIAGDLHVRINNHESRLVALEVTKCVRRHDDD
jgi:hypothetical protein